MNTTLLPHLLLRSSRDPDRPRPAGRRPGWSAIVPAGLGLFWSVLFLPTFSAPAQADWLVTTEGARIETKGPWQVKGRVVVFTRPDGTLASLRTDGLDLDASAQATEEAKHPPEPEPPAAEPEKPEPVITLTNRDIKRGRPIPTESAEEAPAGEKAAGEKTTDGAARMKLRVVSWEPRSSSDFSGVMVEGRLRNDGDDYVTQVRLEAVVFDNDGEEVFRGDAFIGTTALAPKTDTEFNIPVEGVDYISRIDFNPRGASVFLEIAPQGDEAESDGSN